MRYSFAPLAVIGLFALTGAAAGQQPASEPATPPAQGATQQPGAENKVPPARDAGQEGAIQNRSDAHQQTESGRAGKNEAQPANLGQGDDKAVMKNGMMNVPGAPTEGAAVPSKYSERNAALDKMPPFAPRTR